MNFAVDIVVKTSVILISAVLLAALLSRASAATRHAIWVLAIASALLLPLAATLAPQLDLPLPLHPSTSVTFWLSDEGSAGGPGAIARSLNKWPPLRLLLVGAWGSGAGLLLLRFFAGTTALRRLHTFAAPADDLTSELRAALSVKQSVRVLFTDRQISPMTWGIVRHTILLPSSAIQWPDERRRLVLAHELAHVKRNDGIVQGFIQIACGLYWFNPLMWYAAHRLRIERERACDDVVLNLGTVATDYADHLVQIVRGLRGARSLSFPAICMAQPSQLESRLVSILAPRTRRRGLSKGAVVTLSTVTLILTILVGAINVSAQRTCIAGGESNAAVIPPRIIKSTPASYPDYGLTLRVEGTVTLEARVDVHGNLTSIRVVKGLGFGLDEQAIAAVRTWQFAPALKDGVPVEAITQIDVDFKLPASVGPPKTKGISETVRIGPGVIPPTVISRVQPDYTEEARAAKYEGTVVVKATIGVDGTLKVEKVLRELDHGLTENAVEELKQWKFKPGLKNGKPVAVSLNIEVNFRLQ